LKVRACAETDILWGLRGRAHHQAAQLRKKHSRGEEDEDAGTVQAERGATADGDEDDGSDIDDDDDDDAGLEEELTASSPIDNVDEYIFFADAFLGMMSPAVKFGSRRDRPLTSTWVAAAGRCRGAALQHSQPQSLEALMRKASATDRRTLTAAIETANAHRTAAAQPS